MLEIESCRNEFQNIRMKRIVRKPSDSSGAASPLFKAFGRQCVSALCDITKCYFHVMFLEASSKVARSRTRFRWSYFMAEEFADYC